MAICSVIQSQRKPVPYGTGFLVGIKNDTGKGLYGYLVTAKHVLKDEEAERAPSKVYLRLNTWNGDAHFIPLTRSKTARASYTYTQTQQ